MHHRVELLAASVALLAPITAAHAVVPRNHLLLDDGWRVIRVESLDDAPPDQGAHHDEEAFPGAGDRTAVGAVSSDVGKAVQ